MVDWGLTAPIYVTLFLVAPAGVYYAVRQQPRAPFAAASLVGAFVSFAGTGLVTWLLLGPFDDRAWFLLIGLMGAVWGQGVAAAGVGCCVGSPAQRRAARRGALVGLGVAAVLAVVLLGGPVKDIAAGPPGAHWDPDDEEPIIFVLSWAPVVLGVAALPSLWARARRDRPAG